MEAAQGEEDPPTCHGRLDTGRMWRKFLNSGPCSSEKITFDTVKLFDSGTICQVKKTNKAYLFPFFKK